MLPKWRKFAGRFTTARFDRAFSLVEVVLAIGITGSALLVIFAALPLGLSSLQEGQRQIVETEIFNKIGAELAGTSQSDLDPDKSTTNYCGKRFQYPVYFDAEGNELGTSATAPAQAVFFVKCATSKISSDVWSVVGVSGGEELLSGIVSIGFHQTPSDPASPPTPNVRRRSFLLSNHGN